MFGCRFSSVTLWDCVVGAVGAGSTKTTGYAGGFIGIILRYVSVTLGGVGTCRSDGVGFWILLDLS